MGSPRPLQYDWSAVYYVCRGRVGPPRPLQTEVILLLPRPHSFGLGSKTSGLGMGDTTTWSPILATIIIGEKNVCAFCRRRTVRSLPCLHMDEVLNAQGWDWMATGQLGLKSCKPSWPVRQQSPAFYRRRLLRRLVLSGLTAVFDCCRGVRGICNGHQQRC